MLVCKEQIYETKLSIRVSSISRSMRSSIGCGNKAGTLMLNIWFLCMRWYELNANKIVTYFHVSWYHFVRKYCCELLSREQRECEKRILCFNMFHFSAFLRRVSLFFCCRQRQEEQGDVIIITTTISFTLFVISFNIIFRYKELPSFHSWWCTCLYQRRIFTM